MDRAKELRTLMKTASRKEDSSSHSGQQSALSGKDKLKMMREMKQQKAEPEAPVRPTMSRPAPSAPVKTIDPKDTKFMEEWKKSSSILPAGFFDGPSSNKSTTAPVAAKPVVSSISKPFAAPISKPQPPTKATTVTQQSSPTSALLPPTATVKNLPMEFFDNPREELVARGVNIQLHIKEQKNQVEKELQTFLNEIDTLKEEVEEEVVTEVLDEAAERAFEEQAIQMAYMTKLAALYSKSDAVVGGAAPPPPPTGDSSAILEGTSQAELENLIASHSSSSGIVIDDDSDEANNHSTTTNNNKSSKQADAHVEDIVYRKLQLDKLKKRKIQLAYSQTIQQSQSKSSSSNSKKSKVDNAEPSNNSNSESDSDDDDDDYSDLNYALYKH